MKKKLLLMVTSILLLLALCACSEPEPVEHTIGEMKFTLPGDLELEEDADAAMQSMIDSGTYDTEDHFNMWVEELQYYYGDDFTLAVSTSYVSYMDAEIDTCIGEIYTGEDITDEGSENIDINGATGKIGYYIIEDADTTRYLYILKDGIFYEFVMSLVGDKYPENYLENIAASISFDADLLEKQTVACGGIQVSLPANYQVLEFEATEDAYDEQWYGWFGKFYMEFSVCYLEMSEWSGMSYAEMVDSLVEGYDFSGQTHSTAEFPLGTYDLISGQDDDGYIVEIAMFEWEGKTYLISSYCESAEQVQDINEIMQTIAVVE